MCSCTPINLFSPKIPTTGPQITGCGTTKPTKEEESGSNIISPLSLAKMSAFFFFFFKANAWNIPTSGVSRTLLFEHEKPLVAVPAMPWNRCSQKNSWADTRKALDEQARTSGGRQRHSLGSCDAVAAVLQLAMGWAFSPLNSTSI